MNKSEIAHKIHSQIWIFNLSIYQQEDESQEIKSKIDERLSNQLQFNWHLSYLSFRNQNNQDFARYHIL